MVNDALIEKIAKAEAAQAHLAEHERLKQDAAQLAGLRQQLANQQWCEGAAPLADNAEQQARTILEDVRPEMIAWRNEFMQTYHRLRELVDGLPALQARIDAAARHCQQAAATRAKIAQLSGAPAHEFGEFAAADWFELWRQLGGTAPDLSPLPSGTRERYETLEPLIHKLSKRAVALYNPANAAKRYQ